jgi:cell wall-associated NlpC family hydrolase
MSRFLDLATDRRPLDIQALLEGGFFSQAHEALSPETQSYLGLDQFGVDDFSRETGLAEGDLNKFFQDVQGEIESDPKLQQQFLEELNGIRSKMGLPPLGSADEAGLQDLSSLKGEDLMALMVMWALQQQNKNSPTGGGGQNRGSLSPNGFANVQPSNNNWTGSGGGGSGGGGTTSGGGGGGGPRGMGNPVNVDSGSPAKLGDLPTGQGSVGDFMKNADAQVGDEYQWGAGRTGSDTNEYDCSGLVIYAAQKAGIPFPGGTAADQESRAGSISVEEALKIPGALLFRGGPPATHVGISLGDGRVLHAKGEQWGVIREATSAGEWRSGGLMRGANYGGSVGQV